MRDVNKEKKESRREKGMNSLSRLFRSVRFTVWIYFAIFITSILMLIWISFPAGAVRILRSFAISIKHKESSLTIGL